MFQGCFKDVLMVFQQPSDTELSGIHLDLGQFAFSNIGDSPRSRGMAFFHSSFLQ